MNAQDWEDWFTWTDRLVTGDWVSGQLLRDRASSIAGLGGGELSTFHATGGRPRARPETSVSASIDQTRASAEVLGAEGSTEDAPPPDRLPSPPRVPLPEAVPEADELAPTGSSEGEQRPPSYDEPLQREVQHLRRQNLSYLRELRLWVDSILAPGNARPRLPSAGEQLDRQNLIAQGDWPQMTGVETVSLEELAGYFRYVYADRLNDRRPLP